jgi:hypothetical protein
MGIAKDLACCSIAGTVVLMAWADPYGTVNIKNNFGPAANALASVSGSSSMQANVSLTFAGELWPTRVIAERSAADLLLVMLPDRPSAPGPVGIQIFAGPIVRTA